MLAPAEQSPAQRLAALPPEQRRDTLARLGDSKLRGLAADWRFWARPSQLAPLGAWLVWLILAGRGWGKTRCGAEWVLDRIAAHTTPGPHRVALVGRTAADVRDTMIEGESGLVACAERRGWHAEYEPSKRRVTITTPDGHTGLCTAYSAEEPDQLRGPQHHSAWCDELAAWRPRVDAVGNTAWTNLSFGLRLGNDPRSVITTTPQTTKAIRELIADEDTHVTRGTTYDNASNLAPSMLKKLLALYEGTRIGRQELLAELLEDIEGALWTAALIGSERVKRAEVPPLRKVVVAIDPPGTSHGDECGIVVVGVARDDRGLEHAYVLADESAGGLTPDAWARRAIMAYLNYDAAEIVVEQNQGGEMTEQVIADAGRALAADGHPTRTIPTKRVHASTNKATRAAPVVALYEQGRVHHVGPHPELEDQMTTWVPDDKTADSPDRIDALVWAVRRLLVGGDRTYTIHRAR
jgi:phage terminase large subunit-like protein